MKLLINNEYKRIYPDKLKEDLNISAGVINKEEYNKLKEGIIKTHKGKEFILKTADFKDLLMNIKRGPQIITIKDAGFIASQLGLNKSSLIIDCGGGSGSATCIFANIAKKVVSIEKNPEFAKLIANNAEFMGLKNIEVINKDLNEYKSRYSFDAINLDLPNPWNYCQKVSELLKNAGRLVIYVPNTTQLIKSEEEFIKKKFKLEHVFELMLREWDVRGQVCHPKFDMLGHTGFIMCFRKMEVN